MLGFFRGQVRYKNCVHTSLLCFFGEPLFAEFQKRIEVAEQHDWNIDMLFCVPDASQCVAERHAVAQRAFRCALNGFAIRDWITEGTPSSIMSAPAAANSMSKRSVVAMSGSPA